MGIGIVLNLLSRLVFLLGSFAINVGGARMLTQEDYGSYGFCMAVVNLAYVLLMNGVRQEVSLAVLANPEAKEKVLSRGIVTQFWIMVPILVILLGLDLYTVEVLGDVALGFPLVLTAGIVLFQGFNFVFSGYYNGSKDFLKESLVSGTYYALRVLLAVSLLLLGFGVEGILTGLLVAGLLTGLPFAYFGRKRAVSTGIGREVVRFDLGTILTTALSFGALTAIMNCDTVLIKILANDNHALGLYSSAGNTAKLVFIFISSFSAVVIPFFAGHYSTGNLKACRRDLGKLVKLSSLLVVPAVIWVLNEGTFLLTFLYGERYASAELYLSILFPGVALMGYTAIAANVFVALGQGRRFFRLGLTAALVAVCLESLAVSAWGALGAAVGLLVVAVILCAIVYWWLLVCLKSPIVLPNVVKWLACGCLTLAGGHALSLWMGPVLSGFGTLILFGSLVMALGLVSRFEIRDGWNSLRSPDKSGRAGGTEG